MAALDVLQLATASIAGATSHPVSFSSVAAGDLLVFVVNMQNGSRTITAPEGVTGFTSVATEWPRVATYARVAQSGDSTTWTFTTDASSESAIHAYRIEGPFSDLTGVTITADASFTANTTRDVLAATVTVADNTLVIGGIGLYSVLTPTFGNSFTNNTRTADGSSFTQLTTARRLYTTGASDVQSTVTWPEGGNVTGNNALIRIAAPSGGGGATPALGRYRVAGPIR